MYAELSERMKKTLGLKDGDIFVAIPAELLPDIVENLGKGIFA